jgi:hypothetical protein
MATLVYGKIGSTRKFKEAEMQIRFLEKLKMEKLTSNTAENFKICMSNLHPYLFITRLVSVFF